MLRICPMERTNHDIGLMESCQRHSCSRIRLIWSIEISTNMSKYQVEHVYIIFYLSSHQRLKIWSSNITLGEQNIRVYFVLCNICIFVSKSFIRYNIYFLCLRWMIYCCLFMPSFKRVFKFKVTVAFVTWYDSFLMNSRT